MSWLKAIVQEVLGMFIDDGHFAVSIVTWLILLVVMRWYLPLAHPWQAPILFVGLATILVESALRRARRR